MHKNIPRLRFTNHLDGHVVHRTPTKVPQITNVLPYGNFACKMVATESESGSGAVVARVKVVPLGVEIEVEDGQTVFHAAIAQGYRWPTVCHGLGSCRTCYMRIVEGADEFVEPDEWELEGLEDLADRSVESEHEIRLACQAVVKGDAVVWKAGVKQVRAQGAPDERAGPDVGAMTGTIFSNADRKNP